MRTYGCWWESYIASRNWLNCRNWSQGLQVDVRESFLDGNLPLGPDKHAGEPPEFVSVHHVERVRAPRAIAKALWRVGDLEPASNARGLYLEPA